jgi:hypothetical protein
MTQILDLILLAAGSFIGLVAFCVWLLAASTDRHGPAEPRLR